MVTAPELARRVGANPKTLRAWLRAKASSGHPLLAAHEHWGRWEFSEVEAAQLAREYGDRDSGPAGIASNRAAPNSAPHQPRHAAARQRSAGPSRSTMPRLSADHGHRVSEPWMGEPVLTLEDLLRPGLRAVCVGINPSPVSVAAGHYYQGRAGQRFFGRLREAAMLPDGEGFEDDRAFAGGVGFTDIIKRPTVNAKGLPLAEYEYGRHQLVAKLEEHQPELVVFAFKKPAEVLFGPFAGNGFVSGLRLANSEVFVMPGPYERSDTAQATLESLAARIGS